MTNVVKEAEKILRDTFPSEGIAIKQAVNYFKRHGFPNVTQTILRQMEARYPSFLKPKREPSKYRVYSADELSNINFLLSMQALGFKAPQLNRFFELMRELEIKDENYLETENKDKLTKHQMKLEEFNAEAREARDKAQKMIRIATVFFEIFEEIIDGNEKWLKSVREKTGL